MTTPVTLSGSCLCGAVGVTGTANEPEVAACHCDMCRGWSSGPYFEVTCENVSFVGEGSITTFRSSNWAERGFCSECGSNLFYHIIDSCEYQIAAGLLDNQSELRLSRQVFTDKKPPYYTLSDKTENMTAAQVFDKYGPSSERFTAPAPDTLRCTLTVRSVFRSLTCRPYLHPRLIRVRPSHCTRLGLHNGCRSLGPPSTNARIGRRDRSRRIRPWGLKTPPRPRLSFRHPPQTLFTPYPTAQRCFGPNAHPLASSGQITPPGGPLTALRPARH